MVYKVKKHRTRLTQNKSRSVISKRVVTLAVLATGMSPIPATHAVDFVLINNAGGGVPFDPDGTKLVAAVQAAADQWSSIITDTHTVTLTIRWINYANQEISDTNVSSFTGDKPDEATLFFDFSNRLWFFDDTPEDDSEFNMAQTLYRDLNPVNQADWFNGSPPDLLDVAYSGFAKGTAPVDAIDGFDLLTVAFHEVGSALGIPPVNPANTELNDGDYDTDSVFLAGTSIGIENAQGGLDANVALMREFFIVGQRKRPAAVDVFAAAASAGWTQIDLIRKDFLTGSDWNTPGNWEGNMVPDDDSETYVRHGGSISLSGDAETGDLTVAESSSVNTGTNTLTVTGETNLSGGTLTIETGGGLVTDTLQLDPAVTSGGLVLNGGDVSVTQDITISATQMIDGFGGLEVGGTLDNLGTLAANSGTLTASGAGSIDLDGSNESGVVQVGSTSTSAQLVVDGSLADDFDSNLTVSDQGTATFNQAWTLGTNGAINLNDSTLAGQTVTVNGDINVTGSSTISAPVQFNPTAAVTVNSDLDLQGLTAFSGGSYTGTGSIFQSGNVDFTADTVISVDEYDLDGLNENTAVTLAPNVTVTLNVNTIDSVDDSFDGTLTLNSASELAVNTPWSIGGGGSASLDNATISGSALTLDGTITGTGSVTSPLTLNGTITPSGAMSLGDPTDSNGFASGPGGTLTVDTHAITLNDSDSAVLNGDTTIAGGSLIASNGIRLGSTGTFSGTGMVQGAVDGQSGSGITLSGNMTLGDVARNDGFSTDGSLGVDTHTVTLQDLDLAGLGGATTINGGTIIAANGVELSGSLTGSGTVQGAVNTTGGSSITLTGDMTLGDPATTNGFNSSIAGGSLDVDTHTVTLLDSNTAQIGGTTTLDGGTLIAANGIRLVRSLNGSGTVQSTVNGTGTSSITATGELTLGDATRTDGFTTTGDINVASHTVTLLDSNTSTLGGDTTIGGGTLIVPNGINLTGSINGSGMVQSRVNGTGASSITATGGLTLGDATLTNGFSTGGDIDVASHTVTLLDLDTVAINGGTTTLDGGSIVAVNGINLGSGATLSGNGSIETVINAASGSTITATGGNLVLGDNTSNDGFTTAGTLNVGSNTVTLQDANAVSLPGTADVTLGGGTLSAANGISLFGSISGSGIVNAAINATGSSSITASGGDLTVGDPSDTGGFIGLGEITVESGHTLTLLDSDVVSLGGTTTLNNGTLDADNGITLLGTITGSGQAQARVSGTGGSSITASGDLTLGDLTHANGFTTTGSLSIGSHTVTLDDLNTATLGGTTTISGGTLTTANGINLTGSISGSGQVQSAVSGTGTSSITATGSLTLGDSTSTAGFSTDGTLGVGSNSVTLNDANAAVLNGAVTLSGGTLTAANGIELNNTLSGTGTIDADVANNGMITGGIGTLRFDGVVSGIGSGISGDTIVFGNGGGFSGGTGGGGTIAAKINGLSGSTITATGDLDLGDPTSTDGFTTQGTLVVNSHTVTLLDSDTAELGSTTTLNGGTIIAPNGVTIDPGEQLTGTGTVNAIIQAQEGSTITATGSLTLGDPTVNSGVIIRGDLNVADHAVTLLDVDRVQLYGTATLSGGTLVAANGVNVRGTVSGFGVVDGRIVGTAAGQIIATGNLSLGDPNHTNGYNHIGTLNVGSHSVTLLDTNIAGLGSNTILDGGTLIIVNGAALGDNDEISGTGTVAGDVNNLFTGRIVGGPGTLRFEGTVTGTGSEFSGDTVEFAPGTGGTGGFVGNGTLTAKINTLSSTSLTANGNLMMGDAASVNGFAADGDLIPGIHTVTLLDADTALLGVNSNTTLAGGTLVADNGIDLRGQLTGTGTVDAKVSSTPGSGITATGSLTIGNDTAADGVLLSGRLDIAGHTVTLDDLDNAELGGPVEINGGTLVSPNGIELTGSLAGTGTVKSDVNNTGAINGDTGVLRFEGTVTGTGTSFTGDTIEFAPDSGGDGGFTGVGTITAKIVGIAGSTITPTGDLTMGDASSTSGFATAGNLNVGSHTVTLEDADTAQLNGATTIAGGTLIAANGVRLGATGSLEGSGDVQGPVDGLAGSTITPTGDLTMGDASSTSGFATAGILPIASHTVTLEDADTAQLNGATTIAGGTLIAANGVRLGATGSLEGSGVVQGPVDGLAGSMITPTGSLMMGDASSTSGFATAGNLNVGSQTVTLLDSDPVQLAGTTTVNGGSIIAANGIDLSPGGTTDLMDGSLAVTAGSQVTVDGTLNVTGSSQIDGPVVFNNTAIITVNSDLSLQGETTYRGGSYTGTGEIHQNADATVGIATTISVGIFDMDGVNEDSSLTINAPLTINADRIDPVDDTYDGDISIASGASLTVNTPSGWESTGTIELDNATLGGGSFRNSGLVSGIDSTLSPTGLTNNGTIASEGGELVLSPLTSLDLDGIADDGVVEAINGDIRIGSVLANPVEFAGTLTIANGRTFEMDSQGLDLGGTMNLQGGSYIAPRLNHDGTINVTAASTLDSLDARFLGSSITALDADLNIAGSVSVSPGATITGPGSLNVLAGGTLGGDGTIVVDVVNQGTVSGSGLTLDAPITGSGGYAGTVRFADTFSPGDAPGDPVAVDAEDLVFESTSTYIVDVGGFTGGIDLDQINATGSVQLGGTLQIDLADGVTPSHGDIFTLLMAGDLSGEFDDYAGDIFRLGDSDVALVPVIDGFNAMVTLVATGPGDANGDGIVDFFDFLNLQNHFEQPGTWLDGDFTGDGMVDFLDFLLMQNNFETVYFSPPALQIGGFESVVSTPEPGTLAVLILGVPMLLRRGKPGQRGS